MPPENQPGHHPAEEADQPDLHAFAAKLGAGAPKSRQAAVIDLARGGLRFTGRTLGGLQERAFSLWRRRRS